MSRRLVARAREALRWLARCVALAFAVGSAVALFLWSLDAVTRLRWAHPWLLWLLPAGGLAVWASYQRWGGSAERGTDLIIDEIHEPGGGVPARMAPLVLAGTLVTHLFGGSAGREGTAVQIGGALASGTDRWLLSRISPLRLDANDRRVLLQAGVAAGFGAVFGTPIAGAIFAIEVLTVGRLHYAAFLPCLAAAALADLVTRAWGADHTRYPTLSLAALGVRHLDPALLGRTALAAVAFGLAAALFVRTTHGVAALARRTVRPAWMRPVLGGTVVIGLTALVGTRDYLGLGVVAPPPGGVSIVAAFRPGIVGAWSWALKLLFTAVTIGSGFRGGEVTPLFFVGATLGHTLAGALHAPVPLFAALGFVAVFAGATKTPIACVVMGVELFGADAALHLAVACGVAVLCSGEAGVYRAQRRAWRAPAPGAPPTA